MAKIEKFEDLEIWIMARELNKNVHIYIEYEQFSKDYKLKNQINGSCGSIMDNIAEGFSRGGNKEFLQFLSISKASSAEFRSQLYRAFDRKYITQEEFNEAYKLSDIISKKTVSLMNYLNSSNFKG